MRPWAILATGDAFAACQVVSVRPGPATGSSIEVMVIPAWTKGFDAPLTVPK